MWRNSPKSPVRRCLRAFSVSSEHFISTSLLKRSGCPQAIIKMSSRRPCISFVATVVAIIGVGTISAAGTLPSASTTVPQNLEEISNAIHELTRAVADHGTFSYAEVSTLRSHQAPIIQLLPPSVGTPLPQCQTMNYELAVNMALKAVESAVRQLSYLEDRLQNEKTNTSHDLEVSPDLGDRLLNQSQAVQEALSEVAYFDQRLQEVETIASQAQEASRNIEEKFQAYTQEEASSKGSCRSPFYQVGDDCLFVDYDHKMTWENARKFCRAFGGDLAVPSDVLILREFIIMFGKGSFWIGGSDLAYEGQWRWMNGSEVDLSVGWMKDQPNDSGEQDCLEYRGSDDWLLNDYKCSEPMHFVCQDAIYE